jgi:hypothetical protein
LAERYRPVATLLPRPCSLGHLCPCVYSLCSNYPLVVLGGGASRAMAGVQAQQRQEWVRVVAVAVAVAA